jgi:hypothetical protein
MMKMQSAAFMLCLALLLLASNLGVAQAQDLPKTDYFDRINSLVHWVNRWRTDTAQLSTYITE